MDGLIMLAITIFLISAVAAHFITLALFPRQKMNKIMSRLPVNAVRREHRPDARSRAVVKPSPDLVYSNVAYDVSKAPLLFTSPVPTDCYWSVSIYQENTDNFFVINDRQIKFNPLQILLVKKGRKADVPDNALVVKSPTSKGILLVRHLVMSDDKLDEIKSFQKQITVELKSYK